jgi:poly(hydroxyalkanoate) depolymerase family esterase
VRGLAKTILDLVRHRRHWEKLLDAAQHQHAAAGEHAAAPSRLREVVGFGTNPGALRMFTYVPVHLQAPRALVVILHGCTQTAAGYDRGAGWGTLAERYGFALLLPEQQAANNPKRCFNWFQPGDMVRDGGEALSIRQMIEKMIVDYGIDRSRVFVTGLSAGGAMTSVMLATYPEVFAAGAIIAGLPYGTASNVQQAFESMFHGRAHSAQEWGDLVRSASGHRGPWPRVSVWHGDRDSTVKVANARDIVAQWTNVHGAEGTPQAETIDGYRRQAWRSGGQEVVEFFSITGMGHGTPLATGSSAGQCGVAGPFLLEVGISSSYHIAKFWGLTEAAGIQDAGLAPSVGGAFIEMPVDKRADTPVEAAGERGLDLVDDPGVETVPDERVEILGPGTEKTAGGGTRQRGGLDISAIITKALTAAGLMKPPV